jgi:2-polyprenyl-3-methyl-5-hydroxy-6-metoxy-1,4-benzoquinol methylase
MSSNRQKYQSGNPVVGRLMDRFFTRVAGRVSTASPRTLLDAGCGEGLALTRLAGAHSADVTGFDVSPDAVARCQAAHPSGRFSVEDIHALPYPDASFDFVICLEVLEHLERPMDALGELARVSRGQLLISVPHEPWFQLGNLARGQHIAGFGNHPEHVQHWGRRGLEAWLQSHPRVTHADVSSAFPWLLADVRTR